ncbi:MAG: sulfatase-like hydrolase/transferase [Planctomycetota bacterium]
MSFLIRSICACLFCSVHTVAWAADRPNVLFIAVDDLRPEIASFGAPAMVTPNLDRLASRGIRFNRAYCMVPTCGASRASLMTGIRPAKNRFVSYTARADEDAPDATTLNTHFKQHGYRTISLGKVFHFPADNRDGWSEPPSRPRASQYATDASIKATVKDRKGRARGPSWEDGGDVSDATYTDGKIANEAITRLKELAVDEKPFFLAVGFTKPHLPFVAPGAYFDRYPVADVKMPQNYFPPKDAPEGAVHSFGELRSYSDIPKTGILSEAKAKELIRGYQAATSYTDSNLGRLLDAYDELGLDQNTIIVLWGDHGWNLGEHTMWCKHSCFETSLRSPLIFVTPESMKLPANQVSNGLVEFIDVYPTLCELTHLPLPAQLDGESLVPILRDASVSLKDAAISRFKNGDTIRTDQFRYTIYRDNRGGVTGHMLYDHEADPDENINIADDPKYVDVVKALAKQLNASMGKPNGLSSTDGSDQSGSTPIRFVNELNLDDDQKPKFLAVQKSMNEKWSKLKTLPEGQRAQERKSLLASRNAQLKKILTGEQFKMYLELRAKRNEQNNR